MPNSGKPFVVDTSPTKEVVVSSLTRDANVSACIFDLIDNSIDAARNSIIKASGGEAEDVLLDSYAGFWIDLHLSGTAFSIEDNSGGISVRELRETALRFGETSRHHLGIGVFGVGLNRALFKIGRQGKVETDTGSSRAIVTLDAAAYLSSEEDWSLEGQEFPSTGKAGTDISISELYPEISQQFADREYVDSLRDEVGQRYGRFIAKGLRINLNGVAATAYLVPYRVGGPFDEEYKVYKAANDVSIHLRMGEHQDHRFKKESDYDRSINDALTSQYGWNVYCNDRAIVIANTDWITGWDNFHSEFYGFVGEVSFVSRDPSRLPWNTTKTGVDLNSETYRQALDDMRRFNARWRQFADQRKRQPAPKLTAIPPAPVPAPAEPQARPRKKTAELPASPRPTIKADHNSQREILPRDLNEIHCQDKLLALVHEGKALDLFETPYAGLALMRMLVEVSTRMYAQRTGIAEKLLNFAVARREVGLKRPLTLKEKRDATPTFDEVIAFMEAEPDLWGTKAGALRVSVTRAAQHQKTLNGALHNTFQMINRSEAFRIRDDVFPLLRHLIESN